MARVMIKQHEDDYDGREPEEAPPAIKETKEEEEYDLLSPVTMASLDSSGRQSDANSELATDSPLLRDETFHSALEAESNDENDQEVENELDTVDALRRRLHFMSTQLAFLAKVAHELQERQHDTILLTVSPFWNACGRRRMSSLELSPVLRSKEPVDTVDATVMTDDPDKNQAMKRKMEAIMNENEALRRQLEVKEHAAAATRNAMAALVAQVDDLTSQLHATQAQKADLQTQVHELEARTTSVPSVIGSEDTNPPQDDASDASSVSEATDNQHNDEDETDLHAKCKLQNDKLCECVQNLTAQLETLRVERDDLIRERDHAVQSADRAWEENTKLAGSANPQQKIKYLQSVKKENAMLQRRVLDLEAKLSAKGRQKSKQSKRCDPQDDDDQENHGWIVCNNQKESDRNQILRKMQDRNKALVSEIARLRRQQHEVRSRMQSQEKTCFSAVNSRSVAPVRWR